MPRGESTFLSNIMGNTIKKPITTEVLEHEHPLHLTDLQPDYPHYEEEYDDDDSDDEVKPQNFVCRQCNRCGQEITWFHRYYYKCAHPCDYSLHKFCGELPLTLKHSSHPEHSLSLTIADRAPDPDVSQWQCVLCDRNDNLGLGYVCLKCDFHPHKKCFRIHFNCAMASVDDRMIYHPSHPHPLAPIFRPLLSECGACGKVHTGIFYVCTTCFGIFIHSDCAFLPKKLMIQNATDDVFSHPHPLILSYSFPKKDQNTKFHPRCRVCNTSDYGEKNWIFTCEKCRYYAHIHCATTRGPGRRLLIKNYEDSDHQDLLHLPFPDESYSIQKHLFSKLVEHGTFGADEGNVKHNFHPHPLILVRTECNDTTSTLASSKTIVLSCHNPMKKVRLLCNACVRPVTSVPFYKCVNDNCNFVLHEWCTRLPAVIENYPGHPEHTLILHSNAPKKFLSVFYCAVCQLICNGFAYSCVQCEFHIDVTCSFIPQNITHEAHSGHLLSSCFKIEYSTPCLMCRTYMSSFDKCSFACHTCKALLHVKCALLLSREIRHKYDKHPMRLSYLPVENHKSDYFCEICENELNPERCFYHCYECAWSVHTACAPHILQSETSTSHNEYHYRGPYDCLNIKFGGIHKFERHSHPLSFVQGIESDGPCTECGNPVEYEMILKCQQCKFVIGFRCCQLKWRNEEIVD